MRVADDIERGAWLRDRVGTSGSVASLVGGGWEAAVRITHPRDDGSAVGALPYPTLATLARTLAAATTGVTAAFWDGWGAWQDVTTGAMGIATTERLDPAELAALRERTRAEMNAALDPQWSRAAQEGPFLELPHRRYFLVDAMLAEFADPEWATVNRLGSMPRVAPTLIWPDDRTWILGTEIDAIATEVAGSRALADALLADPTLRASEIRLDDPLTYAW